MMPIHHMCHNKVVSDDVPLLCCRLQKELMSLMVSALCEAILMVITIVAYKMSGRPPCNAHFIVLNIF